jgi:Zn-finger nucleic acid-binding protein
MRVIQVKCPQCNSPIQQKQKDKIFVCTQCNTVHVRNGGIEKLDVEIAEFNATTQGERIYAPFWRVYATFVVRSKSVEGGTMFRLMQWVKGGSDGGNMFIYIPATELDPASFRRMATTLTTNPPKYPTRLNFANVPRLPALLTKQEANELADFVVVTIEADQPGVLQRLDYNLTINDTKLVYLPFVKTAQGLTAAY